MIFVDTNVFIYAVGRPHSLKHEAEEFFRKSKRNGETLATSAEVLQELLHYYLPSGRYEMLGEALALVDIEVSEVWSLESGDVRMARQLHDIYPELEARDLCHLASYQNRGVKTIMTFDQPLLAAASA